jgi:ribose transport system substrate-binding protein
MESTIVNLSNFKEMLVKNKVDSVVALDNSTLEKLVDFVVAENLKVKVYGIGNTDKVVYYLDKGVIESIVFQNEFSMGYLGIEKLYHKITNNTTGETPEIAFRVIDKNTMYTQDNQRLLFPQVQ